MTGLTTAATLTTSGDLTANGRVIARANGSCGTIRCVPNTTTGESAVGFYRNGDSSVQLSGDFWAVGHNAYGPGEGSFGIGCHNTNLCLSISPSGTVNIPYALQIGGTSTNTLCQQRAWIQAIIPSAAVNGPVTIATQSGVATLSASRSATGTYALTWSPNINNTNYLVQGNVRNAAGFVSFNGTVLGGCNILTYNAAGALTDIASGCHVMIFRMP